MIALLRKEAREHWRFMLLLYLIGGLMFLLMWIQARSAISPLAAWRSLLLGFGVPAAILLPNRLVMREYGLGTQLFLESLPIGRGTVLLTKWLAGWIGLLLFLVPAFGLMLYAARHQVYLNGGLVGLMALRSLVFLAFVYAGAFAIALTLRFRFALWGLLFLGVVLLSVHLQQPMTQWPPFLVAGEAMALEGVQPPWREIAITAAMAGGLLAAALLLALSARGALVVVLARRLSAGARTLLAFAFGAVFALSTLLEKRVPPQPFRLEQAVSSQAEPAVQVGWTGKVGGVAPGRLAESMSSDLAAMQGWLGLGRLAPLSLVPDAWREADDIGFGKAGRGQLVVRAALGAPDLALPQLQEMARIAQILDQSPAYDWREDRTWLLRGFSAWWQAERTEGYAALLQRRAAFAARLLHAHGLDPERALRQSETTDQLLGDCLGAAYAWRAMQVLHARLGAQGFQALMRAALAQHTTDDARSLLRASATADLLAQAGMPLAQLAQAMRLAPLPAPPTTLQVQPARLAGAMFELRYRILGAPPGSLVLGYKTLQPGESSARPDATYRAGAASGVLPATFTGGSRVLVMAEAYDAGLACRYRIGAVRAALP